MWWWLTAAAGLVLLGALVAWAAQAYWVKLISERWNAMCADETSIRPSGPRRK